MPRRSRPSWSCERRCPGLTSPGDEARRETLIGPCLFQDVPQRHRRFACLGRYHKGAVSRVPIAGCPASDIEAPETACALAPEYNDEQCCPADSTQPQGEWLVATQES